MTRLYVTGLGAFTPVGIDAQQTMGSLLSRLQWFDDLELTGATDEPVSGARVRLRGVENATDLYAGMSRFALAECRDGGPRAGSADELVPLFLATSATRDLPCAPRSLLERVLDADEETGNRATHGALDRRGSSVFAAGRTGALRALAAAEELISSGRARACYVGGVDSLMDPLRLNELLGDGRLLDGAGSDGFVPGEAAVFVKLEARPGVAAGAVVLGAATIDEPRAAPVLSDEPAPPATGAALARAATAALRAAHVDASSLAAIVHDGSSEQAHAEELAMALSRLPFAHGVSLRPWAPAFSVGETGAAAALLAVAMTSFFLREQIFTGPTLVWLTSESTMRAALVMGPSEPKRRHRG